MLIDTLFARDMYQVYEINDFDRLIDISNPISILQILFEQVVLTRANCILIFFVSRVGEVLVKA